MTVRRLRDAGRYGVGAVAVLALAAACDSGSSADFAEMAAAGTPSAGMGSPGGSSSAGQTNSGGKSSDGGSNPGGGVDATGGVAAAGTSSGTGGSAGSGGASGSAGTSGGGGTAGTGTSGSTSGAGDGGMAGSGDAGAPNLGGMGGETSPGGGEAGQGGSGEISSCEGKGLSWAAHPSDVMLLVDRSGTMFDVNNQPWLGVRDAVLPVVDAYDKAENIGFMAMTGELATCPILDEVAPAAMNYAAISAKYNPLVKPTKGESPFMMALSRAKVLLDAAPAAEKFVIMVIDGQPDFCGDGNDVCPIDSVVARIQLLKAAGITTLVAGLPLTANAVGNAAVYAAALQSYANAGAGLPTASADTVSNIYYQCTGVQAWNTEFTASGKTAPQALGAYSASPGSAVVTNLAPANQAGMSTAFDQLFARTQSCTVTAAGGKVPLATAATGTVKVGGAGVPYNAANGWQMKSETELELVGTACVALRAAPDVAVSIDLPCTAN